MSVATDRLRQQLAERHPLDEQAWREEARCKYVTVDEVDFFSNVPDERYRARGLCYAECPVRFECLQYALDTLQINGIWGACDEYELRRTLGVNANGDPSQRARAPRCPYCLNRKLDRDDSRGTITCSKCSLHWPIIK